MSKIKFDFSIIEQGSFIDVVVDYMGKKATKNLKVCRVKARSILFIEVDKPNRKNIFRKVDKADVILLTNKELHVAKDLLPVKWESEWDAIGSSPVRNYGRMAYAAKPFSNHSKGWSSNAPQYQRPTTNSAAGFPMV